MSSAIDSGRWQDHQGTGSSRDRGVTLIEILVSVVLLGTVGAAVLVAFATATRGSALSARVADQQAQLASAHDAISTVAPYADCTATDPATEYGGHVDSSVTVTGIEYWNGTDFVSGCVAGALQRITLVAASGPSLQIAKGTRTGLATPPSTTSPPTTSTTTTTTTTTSTTTTSTTTTTTTTVPASTTTTTEPDGTTTTTEPDGTTSTTSTTAPTTTTTTVPVEPWVPTDAAEGFTILVEHDARTRLSSTGAVAVGGDLEHDAYHSIVTGGGGAADHVAAGESEPSGLVVDGTYDLSPGGPSSDVLTVVRGNVYVGDLRGAIKRWGGTVSLVRNNGAKQWHTPRTDTNSTQSNGSILRSGVFPFASAFAELRQRSADLAGLDPTTCPAVHPTSIHHEWSTPHLQLEPGRVNVLTTSVADLAAHGWIQVPTAWSQDTPLVVNLTDAGSVHVPTFQWAQDGDHSALVWNLPNATHVTLAGNNNFGTIFAPGADVVLPAAYNNHSGTLIARSLTHESGGATVTSARFTAEIPCGTP